MFCREFGPDFEYATAGLRAGYRGDPYCLVRFADGEAAILGDRRYQTRADHWSWRAGANPSFQALLRDSLALDLPGWCVGVTARDCHERDHAELMRLVTVPPDRLTFAELFCYANFMPFQRLDPAGWWVVGPNAGQRFGERGHSFSPHAMKLLAGKRVRGWAVLGAALWWMLTVPRGPIVLACGPAAKVLAMQYWRATAGDQFERRVVVDAGSAMDWHLRERLTRTYQRQKHELSRYTPIWRE